MRAVVTGGTGFIGSHLVEELVARGDDVVCITRSGAARRWLAGVPAQFVDCGFQDRRQLARAIAGANVVFHVAGRTHGLPAELYASNTSATARLLRAAAAQGSAAPHVIVASSIAAVGPCRDGGALSLATLPAPISRYGRSKLAAEAQVRRHEGRVPATILRLPSVYGPRERALFRLIKWIARGFALTVGTWDREASLIHVRDVVQGMIAAAGSPPRTPGVRIYYLAHPAPVSWAAFAAATARAVGRGNDPMRVSLPLGPALALAQCADWLAALRHRSSSLNRERVCEISQRRWVCDPSSAIEELGLAPAIDLEEGIREAVDWYRWAGWL